MLTTVLPMIALVLVAVTRAVGLAPVRGNWTLANFATALDCHTVEALWHSGLDLEVGPTDAGHPALALPGVARIFEALAVSIR